MFIETRRCQECGAQVTFEGPLFDCDTDEPGLLAQCDNCKTYWELPVSEIKFAGYLLER